MTGYSDHLIKNVIRQKLDKNTKPDQPAARQPPKIIIYHQNHFHDRYQEECHALKSINRRGVTPTDPTTIIHFRIYCKPNLTRSLVMRNSTAPATPNKTTTNVVYKFS
ncbi:hypothetical protein Pcinc_031825 [Petrolisthes cinctipes]|uniref:Uncharacterized protein n=1 Tax=Petrolisthes cinctipes TaxID=88211 RepID=A0AAE1K217_PETCI|nr:hypothetical protein Pcinc_031825 [Petrolisthes cinctipes]